MPSPKPRPAKLRLLTGRHDGVDSGGRKVLPPPPFRRMPPEQPTGLTGEAVEHWDLLVGELSRLDLLKPIDGGSLAMACESWSKWRQAESVIREEGVIGENSQGRVVHPAVRVSFDASREYRAWVAEFGLSPSAEGKLGGGNKERESGSNPFTRSADSS